uniref:Uncharacterized protein n=1 Tax=Arundo donax TaxID=35708 RepID=A0A0A9DF18_ARUDO
MWLTDLIAGRSLLPMNPYFQVFIFNLTGLTGGKEMFHSSCYHLKQS